MSFKIGLDHPIWLLSETVAEYSHEFMKSHHLSYFQYLRCYSDGSIACLLNTTELFKTFLTYNFPILSSFDSNHEKFPSYVFFWDEELPSLPVEVAREKHGMHHGITLVKRHKDYYDMIAFAMAESRSNAMAYYFNHLKSFETFSDRFIKTRTDLISAHEREKIFLPKNLQDQNCSRLCLPDRPIRFQIRGKYGPTYLTAQEIFCLQFLNQGKSYKEVSNELSVSVRTIETYLERVKTRTGYSTREQILDVLALCP